MRPGDWTRMALAVVGFLVVASAIANAHDNWPTAGGNSRGAAGSGELKLDIGENLILNDDGAQDSYLVGNSDNGGQFWVTGVQIWSATSSNFTVDVGNLDFAGTGPHNLILDDGAGSGDTYIVGENNGDMTFYADGTLCCYLDESASNFTLQNFNLNFAATNRTIRNSGGPVEFQANHSPTAASTDDISVEDGAEFNWSHGRTKSADPCSSAGDSSVPNSAIYMSSGGFPCYCDGSGVDKLVSSNADCTY